MRKPWPQAIINLVIPGLSYIILGKRVVFGWLFFISTIAWYAILFVEPGNTSLLVAETALGNFLVTVGVVPAAVALSYDAYSLAKESEIQKTDS